MLVAGEASGDEHASALVREISRLIPAARFIGCAGPKMRAAGVEAIVEADKLSIVGVGAVLRALPMFLRIMSRLRNETERREPDVVILVDFPEFNLRLARSLKRAGNTVIYYISPQLWAWREYRMKIIRRYVDLLLSILPFEKTWYAQRGIQNVKYVGHPLVGSVKPHSVKHDFCDRNALDPDQPIIALLPGSRAKEIRLILPEMLGAAAILNDADPFVQFVIALPNGCDHKAVKEASRTARARGYGAPKQLIIGMGETYDALKAADAAAIASGTATLEAALIGTPMAVVYKMSRVDGLLLRPLINVKHVGLVNLLADAPIVAELIQNDLNPTALAAELQRLLDPETNARMREQLVGAATHLGEAGASRRAAEAIVEFLAR